MRILTDLFKLVVLGKDISAKEIFAQQVGMSMEQLEAINANPAFQGVPILDPAIQSLAPFMGVPILKSTPYSQIRLTRNGRYMSSEDKHIKKDRSYIPEEDHIQIYMTSSYYKDHPLISDPLNSAIYHSDYFLRPLLAEARKRTAAILRSTGIGTLNLAEVTFDAKELNKKVIQKMIDKVQSGETVLNRSEGKVRDDQRVMIIGQSKEEVSVQRYSLLKTYDNLEQAIFALANDAAMYEKLYKRPQNRSYYQIWGVDKLCVALKDLPAEIFIELERFKGIKTIASDAVSKQQEAIYQKKNMDHVRQLPMSRDHGNGQRIRSEFMHMKIKGEYIAFVGIDKGQFVHRKDLSALTPLELKEFYEECQADVNSKVLCEAYFRSIDFDDFRKREWTQPDLENPMEAGSPYELPMYMRDPATLGAYRKSQSAKSSISYMPPELRGASGPEILAYHAIMAKRDELPKLEAK